MRSHLSLALPLALTLAVPSLAAAQEAAITQTALPAAEPQGGAAFPVGKWPEGVAASAGSIWVAQSGVRSVARFDPTTGRKTKTIKIGRLPVAMAVAPDGAVIVQVSTDSTVKRVDARRNTVKTLATLPDYPNDLVVSGNSAYVLLWKDGSSAGSSVAKIDLSTRKMTRSGETGEWGAALAVGAGRVWIARSKATITTLDAETLGDRREIPVGGRPFHIAYAAGAAFASTGTSVVRVPATTATVTHRVDLGEDVRAIGAWDDLVAVSTKGGTLWLMDPHTLAITRRLQPPAFYDAQRLTRDREAIFVTHHAGKGDGGTVVRVPIK